MSDTAKLIKIGDGWYHQIAVKHLKVDDGKHYCLRKTDKKNVFELVENEMQIEDAGELDLSGLLTKEDANTLYVPVDTFEQFKKETVSKEDFEVAHEETHYGIRGDYCAHYGIVKVYDKIASSKTGTAQLTIHGGLTLDMPGKTTLTTIASNMAYTIKGGKDCTIFLSNGSTLREAQELFWQTNEPKPTMSTAAWWSPKTKQWSFYENNVWTTASSAQPLLDAFLTNGNITRISFAGYRLLDTQVPLTYDMEYPELLTEAKTIIGAINEAKDVADVAEAIADAAVAKAKPELLTESKYIVGAINEVKTATDGFTAEILNINEQLETIESSGASNTDVLQLKSDVETLQNEYADVITFANNNSSDIEKLKSTMGSVTLSTTNKTCTGAITEINNKIGTAALTTQAKTINGAINELAAAHDSNSVMHGMLPEVVDSTAEDLETLRGEFNGLLAMLRGRGVIG